MKILDPKALKPGTVMRHRLGPVVTLSHRKNDDTGWWNTDASGFSDTVLLDDADWTVFEVPVDDVDHHDGCKTLIIQFLNDTERHYPIHGDGDWRYDASPDRVIVRPHGRGVPRHEIPLRNVASLFLVPAHPATTSIESEVTP